MLFLSIHPEYVNAIVEGRKTVELRKRRPRAEIGSTVVIYATMPRCEVVATAKVMKVQSAEPPALWQDVKRNAAVTKERFDAYFADAKVAVGIHLTEISVLDNPIQLSDLRRKWGDFHPPQQFRYLDSDQQILISGQCSRILSSCTD